MYVYIMIIDVVFDTKNYLKFLFTVFRNRNLGTTEVAKNELVTLQVPVYSCILPNCSFSSDSHGYFIYNTTNKFLILKNISEFYSLHASSL